MAKLQISTKRMQIDKANTSIFIALSLAAAILVFALIASNALYAQGQYQSRVIKARKTASSQLKDNVTNLASLEEAYKAFTVNGFSNIIGGTANGSGPKDGDNARLILDALPSRYDFPALATSLEKILKQDKGSYTIDSISGTDDQATQEQQQTSPTPQTIDMPFKLVAISDYPKSRDLIRVFELSIRPFSLSNLEIAGVENGKVKTSIEGKTYYQPGKNLQVTTKVIK
jgi:hypothetical protein